MFRLRKTTPTKGKYPTSTGVQLDVEEKKNKKSEEQKEVNEKQVSTVELMIRGQQRGQLGRSCRLMRRMDIDFGRLCTWPTIEIYATIASSACENAKLTHPLGAPYEKSVLLIETNFLVNAMIMLKLNPIIFEWLQLNDYAHQEASLITQK
ncbi:hypothetical protein T08_6467 [Trichinella sp. T8]|nr:hypothetical protein T08_6467 [Trichinella sp. T8]